jgi:hypothetical protein
MTVSQATVSKYMPRGRRPPLQTWPTFLKNHVGQIVAADFFAVPTATLSPPIRVGAVGTRTTGVAHSRTHLSLAKDAPIPRAVAPQDAGSVVAIPQVGGFHHRYERRAA